MEHPSDVSGEGGRISPNNPGYDPEHPKLSCRVVGSSVQKYMKQISSL